MSVTALTTCRKITIISISIMREKINQQTNNQQQQQQQ